MKNNLNLSTAGIAAILLFEGCRLQAYQDKANVWTIGFGSTYHSNGKPIRAGERLADKAEALKLFRNTVSTYEQAVNQLVMVPLNQNQYDALVSFAYNNGTNALAGSTLLKLLNGGHYVEAADQFLRWNKITNPVTGKKEELDDLTIRRRRERLTFLKPVS